MSTVEHIRSRHLLDNVRLHKPIVDGIRHLAKDTYLKPTEKRLLLLWCGVSLLFDPDTTADYEWDYERDCETCLDLYEERYFANMTA